MLTETKHPLLDTNPLLRRSQTVDQLAVGTSPRFQPSGNASATLKKTGVPDRDSIRAQCYETFYDRNLRRFVILAFVPTSLSSLAYAWEQD
jgi:hypothetical protein